MIDSIHEASAKNKCPPDHHQCGADTHTWVDRCGRSRGGGVLVVEVHISKDLGRARASSPLPHRAGGREGEPVRLRHRAATRLRSTDRPLIGAAQGLKPWLASARARTCPSSSADVDHDLIRELARCSRKYSTSPRSNSSATGERVRVGAGRSPPRRRGPPWRTTPAPGIDPRPARPRQASGLDHVAMYRHAYVGPEAGRAAVRRGRQPGAGRRIRRSSSRR